MNKSTVIAVDTTHPAAEEAVKELENSGFDMKKLSMQPLLHPSPACTIKSTVERLQMRTRELAVLAGRRPLDITQRDYEQAKREMRGEPIKDRQHAVRYAVN